MMTTSNTANSIPTSGVTPSSDYTTDYTVNCWVLKLKHKVNVHVSYNIICPKAKRALVQVTYFAAD